MIVIPGTINEKWGTASNPSNGVSFYSACPMPITQMLSWTRGISSNFGAFECANWVARIFG